MSRSVPPSLQAYPGGRARRAATAVAAALVVACGAAPAADARPRVVQTVDRVFASQPLPDPDTVLGAAAATATGNGHIAWVAPGVEADGSPGPTAAVWTLRDGAPVRVLDLPLEGRGLGGVELGTGRDGVPLLIVSTWARGASVGTFRVVDLEDGSVRALPASRRGRIVADAAIDAGRLFLVLGPERSVGRGPSSLWRATITARSVGRPAKLRSSGRGRRWYAVDADAGRVAVSSDGPAEKGLGSQFHSRSEIAFGTPRGPWARTGVTYDTDYGYWPYVVLGFARRGHALVVAQGDEDDLLHASRRLAHERREPRTVRLGASRERPLAAPSYDPVTRRIVAFGPDASGAPVVGSTAPVFGP